MIKEIEAMKSLLILIFLMLSYSVNAIDAKSAQQQIDESIASYSGSCPCPYNKQPNGERCGKESAWYKPGSESLLCFESDIKSTLDINPVVDAGVLNAQAYKRASHSQVYKGKANNYNSNKAFAYYGMQLPERGVYSDPTLGFYFSRQLHYAERNFNKYAVNGLDDPYVFESKLQNFDAVTDSLEKTGLVSYLFYEDGKIKVDKKSPEDRFGHMFNNNSQLIANSMGKSMVSYVLGHAICKGYIKDINEKMDWELLEGTLYEGQKLIDLINMTAGDQNYVDKKIGMLNTRSHPNNFSISKIMNGELKGTIKSNRIWNYNGLPPNIVINYIMHKVGDSDKYQKLLNDIFQKKVGIENQVWFVKGGRQWYKNEEKDGHSKSSFYASRYDYLRIAKSMLDDWNNDTCVGGYLKTIYKSRVNKNYTGANSPFSKTKKYGGFFHTDYPELFFNSAMLVMDGYGGQMIWINFDDNRIVVANAITANYDWQRIVVRPIIYGL